jgi:hypothetical protein
MRCFYYLAPTLKSTQQISEDLHNVGVMDWFLHIIARDEAGLRREHLHSSNYLETTDILRDGLIGANIGFILAVIVSGSILLFEPFGPNVPKVVYFFAVAVFTLFGAWVGGLTGIDKENKKLRRFHDDLEAGKYLILIYARKEQEEKIRDMMRERHPEARLAAIDRHFLNPFSHLTGNSVWDLQSS